MNLLELLNAQKKTTRKELLATGISDYQIKKLVSDNVLIKTARADYEINPEKVKEFLSKNNKIEEVSFDKNIMIPVENLILEKHDTQSSEGLNEPSIETKSRNITFNQLQVPIKEIMTLDELWDLYIEQFNRNPLLAKKYLERYMNLCIKEGVAFDYSELITIETKISNIGISKEQLIREKEISDKIRKIIRTPDYLTDKKELITLIEEFNESYKNRGFYADYYLGCYELKNKNHKKAIQIFKKILQNNPINIFALQKLSEAYFKNRNYHKCSATIKKYIEYDDLDPYMYILLAKTYIKRNKLDELVLLSQELIENNEIDLKQYLEKVENALYGEIASKEKLLRKNPNMILTSTIDKIKELSEAIRQHQEMQGRFLSNNRNTNDDILKERISQIYDSEIYNCLTSEQDNHIHLSNIRPYIDNLDITLDDRLLLYLSAARVLFMNKFPKQAEQYLQLVERTPDKSEKIKEEYDRCQKNKKLYLNK